MVTYTYSMFILHCHLLCSFFIAIYTHRDGLHMVREAGLASFSSALCLQSDCSFSKSVLVPPYYFWAVIAYGSSYDTGRSMKEVSQASIPPGLDQTCHLTQAPSKFSRLCSSTHPFIQLSKYLSFVFYTTGPSQVLRYFPNIPGILVLFRFGETNRPGNGCH